MLILCKLAENYKSGIMKKRFLLLIIGISFFSITVSSKQWKSFDAPRHPVVNHLWVNPVNQNLVVSGVNEFFSSVDNGMTWFPWAEAGGKKVTSAYVSFEGDTLFILVFTSSTGIANIFSSTDMGKNWTQRSSTKLFKPFGSSVSCFLVEKGEVYIGINDSLLKSSNYGNSYTRHEIDVVDYFNTIRNALFTFDGDLYGIQGTAGVYKSTDDGISWTNVKTGIPNANVYDYQIANGKLYISTYNGVGVLNGAKDGWIKKSDPNITAYHNSQIIVNNNIMVLSHRTGLIYSTDTGNTFQNLDTNGVPVLDRSITGLVRSGDYYILGGKFGVLRAQKDTLKFYSVHHGFDPSNVVINRIFPKDNGKLILSNATGVYIADSINNTYVGSKMMAPFGAVFIDKFQGQYFMTRGNTVFVSNNGHTWEERNFGLPINPTISGYSMLGNKLVTTTSDGLYVTYNLQSWSKINITSPSKPYSAVYLSGDKIYVSSSAGSDKGIYVADTATLNFTNISGSFNEAVDQITSDGNMLYVINDNKVYMNGNATDTHWVESEFATQSFQKLVNNTAILEHNGVLYISTNDGPMYSSDQGASWDYFRDGLDAGDYALTMTTISNDTIYGFNQGKVFFYVLDQTVSLAEHSKVQPLRFYPNPANKFVNFETKITSVNIYDINGMLIKSKQNTSKLNISEIKPGVYILEASQKGNITRKKILIQ